MGWLLLPVVIYVGFILYYNYHFYNKKRHFNSKLCPYALPEVSVVIPLRNEAQHIRALIQSLSRQAYPVDKLEFIWVNDHSTDNTWDLLQATLSNQAFSFPYRLITLGAEKYGKRQALTDGIRSSTYNIIATLDADCTVSPYWIYSMVGMMQQLSYDMVMGPVLLNYRNSFFSKFMALEQLSLTATAAASTWAGNPILCSGANLIFYKADYLEYIQNSAPTVTVGDDMFFMTFLKKKRKRIEYLALSDAVVLTEAPSDIGKFLNQRIRWVSKSRYYSDLSIILAALLVAIANASLVSLMLCTPFIPLAGLYWAVGFFIKTCIDFPILYMAACRFEQKNTLYIYPLAQLFYPIFVTVVSIYGNFGMYTWKQRIKQMFVQPEGSENSGLIN